MNRHAVRDDRFKFTGAFRTLHATASIYEYSENSLGSARPFVKRIPTGDHVNGVTPYLVACIASRATTPAMRLPVKH
jgi:hypothetical protein